MMGLRIKSQNSAKSGDQFFCFQNEVVADPCNLHSAKLGLEQVKHMSILFACFNEEHGGIYEAINLFCDQIPDYHHAGSWV